MHGDAVTAVAVVLVLWMGLTIAVRVWAARQTVAPPVPEAMQERVRILCADDDHARARRMLRREVPTRPLEASAAVRHLAAGRTLFTSWDEIARDLDPVVAERVRSLAAEGERGQALRAVRRATGLSMVGSVRLVDALVA